MSTKQRRERERSDRRAAILTAARELADAEGWDAVTTRRLAERIEYSQPVLYSHFAGKAAIVDAVAEEGFSELAAELRARIAASPDARAAFDAVVRGYLDLARSRPAVYAAMFAEDTTLPFAAPDTPDAMLAGFGALRDVLAAVTGPQDIELRTELLWSTLHGLATLTRTGRLPASTEDGRIALLLATTLRS